MKIIIIGSVASGTSVAAKARRNTESAEITLYDKDTDISYAVCGIPYAIGGEIADFEELTPRDAKWFKKRYNVDIHTSHEVLSIDQDVTIDNEKGNVYFKVKVKLDKTYLADKKGEKVNLILGMVTETRVKYEKITYMKYFMEQIGIKLNYLF